jgi:hypothetical protein
MVFFAGAMAAKFTAICQNACKGKIFRFAMVQDLTFGAISWKNGASSPS